MCGFEGCFWTWTLFYISDSLSVFLCFVHIHAELSILCNDIIIYSSVDLPVKPPTITSVVPSVIYLGNNRFHITLSNAVLNPRVALNNSCSHVISDSVSIIASCLVQEVHFVNRLIVEIPDSNIPPIFAVSRILRCSKTDRKGYIP